MKFKIIVKAIIFIIRLYQKALSPFLGHWIKCRFYPTCSEYAILYLEKYGLIKGLNKTYHRLIKCRPDNLDSCIDLP